MIQYQIENQHVGDRDENHVSHQDRPGPRRPSEENVDQAHRTEEQPHGQNPRGDRNRHAKLSVLAGQP
jgi:hypothetical protein